MRRWESESDASIVLDTLARSGDSHSEESDAKWMQAIPMEDAAASRAPEERCAWPRPSQAMIGFLQPRPSVHGSQRVRQRA